MRNQASFQELFDEANELHDQPEYYDEAISLAEQALALAEKWWGKENIDVAEVLDLLGIVYCWKANWLVNSEKINPDTWNEASDCDMLAESYLERALKIKKYLVGEKHQSAIKTSEKIVQVYWIQKRIREAIKIAQDIFEWKEKNLGMKNPETIKSLAVLAGLHLDAGREAQTMFRSRNKLNNIVRMKFATSIRYYRRVLNTEEKIYGRNHEDTFSTIENLGNAYFSLRKFSHSANLYGRLLRLQEINKGHAHELTLKTMLKLAEIFHCQRKYSLERKILLKAVDLSRKKHGLMSMISIRCLERLAQFYKSRREFSQSESCLKKLISIAKKNNFYDLESDSLLALQLLYQDMGDKKRAVQIWAKRSAFIEKISGFHRGWDLVADNVLLNVYDPKKKHEKQKLLDIALDKVFAKLEHEQRMITEEAVKQAGKKSPKWKVIWRSPESYRTDL